MKSTIDDLISRRSIRKFKSEQITDEELNTILKVGTYAASGRGKQASKIIVIQDKETIQKLSKLNASFFPEELKSQMPKDIDPFFNAPTILLVIADKTVNTYIEDGSLVIGNLLNAANAINIGSCWIHRAKEEFNSREGKKIFEKLNIPDNYEGIGHCILGYANETPTASKRKEDYILYL